MAANWKEMKVVLPHPERVYPDRAEAMRVLTDAMRSMPDSMLERIVAADRWTAGVWLDDEGNRCLLGHAVDFQEQGEEDGRYVRSLLLRYNTPEREWWERRNGTMACATGESINGIYHCFDAIAEEDPQRAGRELSALAAELLAERRVGPVEVAPTV